MPFFHLTWERKEGPYLRVIAKEEKVTVAILFAVALGKKKDKRLPRALCVLVMM